MGNISKGILFRGSYPIFEDKERDDAYDKLVADAKIACVINLADNETRLERIAKLVPWYNKLLESNNVIGLDIQFEFDFENKEENEVFKNQLKQGLKFLIKRKGPYLVHCNAGTDRTGFFAAILEGLFGAETDEIVYDYLLSYGKKFAGEKHTELNINTGKIILEQINTIVNGKLADKDNFQSNIENYFRYEIGLTIEELEMLKERLAEPVFL